MEQIRCFVDLTTEQVRLKRLENILDYKTEIYRSAGNERKAIAWWAHEEGVDILGQIDILGSSMYGWVSRLLMKNPQKPILASEVPEMENIDLFRKEVFLNWFVHHRKKYPKMIRCVIMLEFVREELLDICQLRNIDNGSN